MKLHSGFNEVIFPPFLISPTTTSKTEQSLLEAPQRNLMLRRAYPGSLELYTWWDKTRHSRKPRSRVVIVELLDEKSHLPVLSWRFSGCLPVSLHYSPLAAQQSALLIESLELSFERIEMDYAGIKGTDQGAKGVGGIKF